MFTSEVSGLAKVIWEYLVLGQPLKKVDVMLVLGSHDLRVAEYAATLFDEGFAPRNIVSGGHAHQDDLLRTGWQETEAEKFAEVLFERGVPREKVILETAARNTGENFAMSRKRLEEMGITFTSALAVTKPYMERRAFATALKLWPDKEVVVSSPRVSFDEYMSTPVNEMTTPDDVLHIMVGDVHRIAVYPKRGWQAPQEIPTAVWAAFNRLKELGYTKHLVAD